MRAVNLIPADQQRGAGGAAGKSGGGAYILLGALGRIVVLAAAYVVAGKSVSTRRPSWPRSRQQADPGRGQGRVAEALHRLRRRCAKRVETVSSLAASRFDWAARSAEVARVLPEHAWLTR